MKITLTKPFVVVPCDFSKMSLHALTKAVEMVGDVNAVQAVHVSYVPSPYEYGIAWETVQEETMARRLEESFRKSIKDHEQLSDVVFTVLFGNPGHRICDFAEEVDAEMIIMPSHGHSGFSRLLMGSVAERVVRYATCPVLVLRQPKQDGKTNS